MTSRMGRVPSSDGWERIYDPNDRRRVNYWNLPVTALLRSTVKRVEDHAEWTIHVRDEPNYGWQRKYTAGAPDVRTAKAFAENYLANMLASQSP